MIGKVVFILAWVFVLVALVLEGALRMRERDEAARRAVADMYHGKETAK